MTKSIVEAKKDERIKKLDAISEALDEKMSISETNAALKEEKSRLLDEKAFLEKVKSLLEGSNTRMEKIMSGDYDPEDVDKARKDFEMRIKALSKKLFSEGPAKKLDLYGIVGELSGLSWELHKAMSPLRAINALEDTFMNAEGLTGNTAKEDVLCLSDTALVALAKVRDDLGDLLDRIEDQDMAESRASQAVE